MDLTPGIAGLALALGVKHAFDADHVVAVGNVLLRSRGVGRAVGLSAAWAAGHMLTAGAVTALLFAFRGTLLAPLLAHAEVLVVGMLIAIGLAGLLWEAGRLHAHRHEHGVQPFHGDERGGQVQARLARLHGGREHTHVHVHAGRRDHAVMGGIGLVHGLASNDELLLVLGATLGLGTLAGALGAVLVFSVGVVLGMTALAVGLALPGVAARSPGVRRAVHVAASFASLGYGALLAARMLG